MDVQVIDQEYQQLQQVAQTTIQELSSLAGKLQTAAQGGDQNAREWLLDLKSVALSVQGEQQQVSLLLQALHNFVATQVQAPPQMPMQQPPQAWEVQQPQQGYPQQGYGGYPQQQGGGGMLGNLLSSPFARAIENGAGFGIGSDLINKIF